MTTKSFPEPDRRDSWYSRAKAIAAAGPKTDRERKMVADAEAQWGPEWMLTANDHRWRARFTDLLAFVSAHGRFPGVYGDTEAERSSGAWLATQVVQRRRLATDRVSELDVRLPGWSSRRSGSWEKRADLLAVFVSENRRLPRRTRSDSDEMELYWWLTRQREAAYGRGNSANTFTGARRERLDAIDPTWNQRADVALKTRSETWAEKAERLAAFNRETGRWPSIHAKSEDEGVLARWRGNQLAANQERTNELDRIAPGWRGHDKHIEWAIKAKAAGDFFAEHGRLPFARGVDVTADETRINRWLHTQRQALSGGPGAGAWTERRERELNELVPGWSVPPASGRRVQ